MVVRVRRRLLRADSGASAVEFALIVPFLAVLLMVLIDVGFALHQRMTMDHILRLGAEAAMQGQSAEAIGAALQSAAQDHATPRMSGMTVDAPVLVCWCAEAPQTPVACDSTCASGRRPSAGYALAAALPYRSLFLQDRLGITLRTRMTIEIPRWFLPLEMQP